MPAQWIAQIDLPLLSIIATAVFTAFAALANWLAVREMRAERLAQSRPFVVIDFFAEPERRSRPQRVFLRLRNLGVGLAKGVCVSFDPTPTDNHGRKLSEWLLFKRAIPVLTPGTEIRRVFHTRKGLFDDASSAPTRQFRIYIDYRGSGTARYSEVFQFDFDYYRDVEVRATTA